MTWLPRLQVKLIASPETTNAAFPKKFRPLVELMREEGV